MIMCVDGCVLSVVRSSLCSAVFSCLGCSVLAFDFVLVLACVCIVLVVL